MTNLLKSYRHTEGGNSTGTDTKTSKHLERNQKYQIGTVSIINITRGGGLNRFNRHRTSPTVSEMVQLYTFINKENENLFEDIKHIDHTFNMYNREQSEQLLE